MMVAYFGFILLVAFAKADRGHADRRWSRQRRHRARRGRDRARADAHRDLRAVGEPPATTRGRELREQRVTRASRTRAAARDLARRAERDRDRVVPRLRRDHARHHVLGRARARAPRREFFAAGGNGLGGAERLRARRRLHERRELPRHRRPRRRLSGFDGLIYSVGWLVGWPVITFLIAEPLRNLGKYTFADVVAYRLQQRPVRIAAAISTLTVVIVLPDRADGRRRQPRST